MLRGVIALVFAGAVATSALADTAFAPWQDETKQVGVAVAQNGWRVFGPQFDMANEMEAAPDPNERPLAAMCILNHTAGAQWVSREHANQAIRQDAVLMRQLHENNARFNLERFELIEVDGVTVLDVYGGIGTLGGLTRRFYLNRNGEMSLYMLMCAAERSDVARLASAINIAQSLRITERAEAP